MHENCACCGQALPADMLAVSALDALANELRRRLEYVEGVADAMRPIAKISDRDGELPQSLVIAAINATRGMGTDRWRWRGEEWLAFVGEQVRTLDMPFPS